MSKVKKFNEIKEGEYVLGSDGRPTRVKRVYEEHIPKDMYEINFGEFSIKASGNHLWYSETDEDLANKDDYLQEAINYFITEGDSYLNDGMDETKDNMALQLASTPESFHFIVKVCETVGHSYETPEIQFDNYMDVVGEKLIKYYSYDSIREYLKDLQENIKNNGDRYFRFGKVRDTNEIYNLIENGENVNIPTLDELKKSNI